MEKISYDLIKELFVKEKYLPTEDLIWRTYIGLMQSVGKRKTGQEVYSICLDGPAGAGKSSFAKAYSKILEEITGEKFEFLTYSCNTKTGKEEIFEDIKLSAAITQDADKLITPGFIAQAINLCNQGKKVVLRIDEYDKAKPETDSYMLEFLQEGRISTSQSGELKLNHPEDLQVILCKNDNRTQLSGPLTRRLNFINLDYTTPSDMATIVGMNMKEQSNAIKLLVLMIYSNIYKAKDDYTRIPSAAEVMIAIDEADILTNGGASKQYVYKNIINNLFKSAVDISTFTSGNKKNGNIDEEIETMKTVFNTDSEEPFDKNSLTLDLYELYFKPLMDELKNEMKIELDELCDKTNEFKSTSDYKLLPIEMGKKQKSKFDLSNNWFMLGEIKSNINSANILAQKADDIKYDGPIFVIEDYYITVVKENMSQDKVNLKFLSNKPIIPTGVVLKIRELVQYMDTIDYNFSFPLISQYKFDEYQKKDGGFYQYHTSISNQPINNILEDIIEIKLYSIKNKTGKIIDGTNVRIEDFGKGNRALLKIPGKGQNLQLEVMNEDYVQQLQEIITIPLKNPIAISKSKIKFISYNKDTKLSLIEISSKKKGAVRINAFEPEKVVEDLNLQNYKEADILNEDLLQNKQTSKKYHILKSLDQSQKDYLTNFIDEEKIDAININDAISNCIDYCMVNDVLDESPKIFYDSSRYKYDSLCPDLRIYSLKMKKRNQNK